MNEAYSSQFRSKGKVKHVSSLGEIFFNVNFNIVLILLNVVLFS